MRNQLVSRSIDVYGIGNAIIDLQYLVADELLSQFGLDKGSMRLVDAKAQQELLEGLGQEAPSRLSGGSAANTMIALAQLGGRGAYGCVVGDDSHGRFYLEEMKSLGIAIGTEPVAGIETGTCVILISPDAERTMNTHLGASIEFGPENICEETLQMADWLYVEGYLFSTPKGRAAIEKAVALAKEHSVRVAITFSDGFIVDCFKEPLRQAVAQADLVFANELEARKFTGAETEEEILSVLSSQVPTVVVTLAERGALISREGRVERVEAVKTEAVDTTGAGDMFAGGFLYGITHGLSDYDSGRLASLLAGQVVSKLGPRLEGDLRQLAAPIIGSCV